MRKMYRMMLSPLFTNIPIKETFNYIIEQLYAHKKLTSIRWKLIFRRLLINVATEFTFKFNSTFFKQMDGCNMVAPLPVTFSDIDIAKLQYDVVIPSNLLSKICR